MAILLTIALAALGFILFLAIGIIVSAIALGTLDFTEIITNDISSVQGLMVIRIIQIFQSLGMFVFPALLLAFVLSKEPLDFLGFKKINYGILWSSVLFMIIALPGINLMASLNAEIPMPGWMIDMEKSAENLLKALLISEKFSTFLLNLFMIAVLPALGEELFFRGVLQKYFCKITRNTFTGVIITAIVFSAIHFQFQGFVPRFVLGMIFGYLYVWSKTIWIPIIVHFINNGVATLLYYFIGAGMISEEVETMGSMTDFWQIGVASIALSSMMLWVIWKQAATSE
jgi:hypothetical protein